MTEEIWIWIAWRLPRVLVYWCARRVNVHATSGEYSHQPVVELRAIDALKRWDLKHTWAKELADTEET